MEGHNGRDFFLNSHKRLPNSLPEGVVRVQEEIFGPVSTEPGPKSEVPRTGMRAELDQKSTKSPNRGLHRILWLVTIIVLPSDLSFGQVLTSLHSFDFKGPYHRFVSALVSVTTHSC